MGEPPVQLRRQRLEILDSVAEIKRAVIARWRLGRRKGLALFFLLAAASFLLWNERGGPGLLPLAGVFTGLCLGTKYTALALVLPPAALAAAFAARAGARQGRALRNVFALALPALLTWAPWPLRNFVNTGNPFYPAGYSGVVEHAFKCDQYDVLVHEAGECRVCDRLA